MTHRSLVSRRSLVAATICFAAALPSMNAQADTAYPSKPVKFINSFPPGGPSDILARSVAAVLQGVFNQPFVVENKPGASGNIGADVVAKSAPDGYTVLFGIDSTLTVNPHIYKGMPFKPADLKPVMIMASSGLLIGVNPATGFKSLNDLISAGKSKILNFSSAGSGSPGHLASAVLTEATGVKINNIFYKGNTPAVMAVLSGEVDGGVLATPGMLPHVKAGKVTALAVTSRQRSALAPEVPTVGELGLKSLEQEVFYVAMVPAATPDAIVQTLQQAFAQALARPDVQARMKALDMNPEALIGQAAAARLSELSDRYARVIKATGLKVE